MIPDWALPQGEQAEGGSGAGRNSASRHKQEIEVQVRKSSGKRPGGVLACDKEGNEQENHEDLTEPGNPLGKLRIKVTPTETTEWEHCGVPKIWAEPKIGGLRLPAGKVSPAKENGNTRKRAGRWNQQRGNEIHEKNEDQIYPKRTTETGENERRRILRPGAVQTGCKNGFFLIEIKQD
jgi:hypothetical protein